MYHSIIIGEKNTWDDWKIVPLSRPVFNPPSQKIKTVDIPGSNGILDLSESLTGYPIYNNREGTFDFYVLEEEKPWYQTYSEIMEYIHGRNLKAYLEDDKEYYYEGRFSVGSWNSSKGYPKISIDYSVGPYKWLYRTSLEEWKWDPFNFFTGVIFKAEYKDLKLTTNSKSFTFHNTLYGSAPISPVFVVDTTGKQGIQVQFINSNLGIDDTRNLPEGNTEMPEYIFYGKEVRMNMRCISGTGSVSIGIRQGRL